ncbi:fructose-bisphosphate aldolase [Escherichia coli]|uniref:Fructose-bisphosphate aldolase n=1 Tax=Escherichia coli TaxID=562 RepID=A0A376Y8M9_ECOLX|nr:fructose-bisphosphate aldolase [Escherichia coli]
MTDIAQLLGKDADNLLQHRCMTIPSDQLYLPGHDYVDRVMIDNNRPPAVLRNMQTLYNTGRLAGTGYLSILPVDQGVEHSAELHLLLTRSTLTRKTLLNWRSKRAVTVWRQLTACWRRYRGVMRIAFHSSSNLITTRR